MTSKLFSKHFKRNILKYTVACSAAAHLIVFYLFPTWNTFLIPDRENVIKIKSVLKKKVTIEEKNFPEPEMMAERKMAQQKKTPEINRSQSRPKSAIIKNVKAFQVAPPLSSLRNPVPIRNSEEIFKPMNTVQEHATFPHPVAEIQNKAQFEVPNAIRPIPRMNRIGLQDGEAPVAIFKKSYLLGDSFRNINQVKSFQPTPLVTKTLSSQRNRSFNSKVQIKYFTEVKLKGNPKPAFSALSTYNGKISRPKTAAVQRRFPVELERKLFGNQPVPEIKNLEKFGLKTLLGSDQGKEIQKLTPKSLYSELTAQYQPAIPIAGNYFSSPWQNTSLLQMASIPSGFSKETPNKDKALTNRGTAKVARFGGGVGEVSEELLRKIKKGFSSQVWTKIAHVKYYPRIARDRGFEGQPVVAFTLGNRGELLKVSIANPSPFELLDEAALDAVKSASPYPPIPELLNMKSIKFKLPISFILEER